VTKANKTQYNQCSDSLPNCDISSQRTREGAKERRDRWGREGSKDEESQEDAVQFFRNVSYEINAGRIT
jgi:hypothetical protein